MTVPNDNQTVSDILRLQSLPENEQRAAAEEISDIARRRVIMRVYEFLGLAERKEFKLLLGQNAPEALAVFLSRHVPDMDRLIAEEISGVKGDLEAWAETIP